MNDLALFGIITIYLLICTAFGFIRGLAKSRIRCITVAASAVLALIITFVMKTSILNATDMIAIVEGFGFSADVVNAIDTLFQSAAISETAVGLVSALIMPLMFLFLFAVICLITWVIHVVVTLILRKRLRESNERAHFRLFQTVLMNLLQGIIVVFVVLVPFNVYSQLGTTVIDAVEEAELLDEMPDLSAMVDDYVDPISESFVMQAFRVTGGELVSNALTDFEVNGSNVHLNKEVEAFSTVICKSISLIGAEDSDVDDTAAELIGTVSDSFDDSDILAVVVGDLVHASTDAWSKGETYIGIARPETGELFDKLVDDLTVILRDDAKHTDKLQADLYTIADVISIMAKYDVFSKLQDDEALTDLVGSNGMLREIIVKLEANESMKTLIAEIHNVGKRAIATYLDLDGEGGEGYDGLMADIAGSLNSTAGLDREARVEVLSEQMMDSFKEANVEIEKSVVDAYAESFIDEFGTSDNVTSDQVSDFLLTYAL